MTRRRTRLLSAMAAIGLAFGMLATAAPALAGVDDFTFESFDGQYYLGRDDAGHSTLRTVETFVVQFPDYDQNRGLLRRIPLSYGGVNPLDPRRVDTDVTVLGVTDGSGNPVYWETYDENGFRVVSIGTDAFVYGRTTYVVEYTQRDVTRHFDDTGVDEFYWDTNGTGWLQPFGEVTATVHLEDGLTTAVTGDTACYWGFLDSTDTCTIDETADGYSASQADLGPQQNLTVAIGFESGTFTPGQSVDQHWIVRVLPWVLLGVLAAIILATVFLRRTRWAHAPGRGIVIPQYEAPDELGVLAAAAFLGTPGRGLPAQFVQFAVQGIARLVEDPEAKASKRYRLELLDRGRAVQPDDDISLRKLFGKDMSEGTLVLDRENKKLGDRIASLVRQNAGIAKQRGLVAKGTSPLTKVLRWPAFACFVVGWFIVIWAGNMGVSNATLVFQLIAVLVGAPIVIAFGGVPERRTQKGSEVHEHLRGLRDYLQLAEADRLRVLQSPEGAPRTRIDPNNGDAVVKLYEKLLPWAMVWGVEREWQAVLGQRYAETQTQPTNLQFSSGLSGLSGFATTSVSSGFAQTVSTSSSSSGGGGSSFSGGSSGGGSSGGGGGGGGGGGR